MSSSTVACMLMSNTGNFEDRESSSVRESSPSHSSTACKLKVPRQREVALQGAARRAHGRHHARPDGGDGARAAAEPDGEFLFFGIFGRFW